MSPDDTPRAPRGRALIIDADACPVVREALASARRARVPVVIVGNTTQNLARHIRRDDPRDAGHARGGPADRPGFWVDIVEVPIGADSADFAIVELLEAGDVVVTQDIGLASMATDARAYPTIARSRPMLKASSGASTRAQPQPPGLYSRPPADPVLRRSPMVHPPPRPHPPISG